MPGTSDPQRFNLDFGKGVLARYPPTVVPNGYAPTMNNWQPCIGGGVEARSRWTEYQTGIGSPNVCRIAWHSSMTNASGQQGIPILFNENVGEFRVFASITTPGVLTALGDTTSASALPDGFITATMGKTGMIFGGPSLDALWRIAPDGTMTSQEFGIPSPTDLVPTNVRALQYHKNSFWAGGGYDVGTADDPTRHRIEETLLWTDPGAAPFDPWPIENSIVIDRNEGTAIVGLTTYGDDLIVGKDDAIYILAGAPPDIDLHRLPGGECARGRPLIHTPWGLFIIGILGVYVYDGGAVTRISDALGDQYISGERVDAAYSDNRLYIVPVGTARQYIYDIPRQAWNVETLSDMTAIMSGHHSEVLYGSTSHYDLATRRPIRPFNEETADGGSDDFYGTVFELVTPEYWPLGTEVPTNFRSLDLRIRQRGGEPPDRPLNIQITVRDTDGVAIDAGTYPVEGRTAGVYNASIPVPIHTGYGIQFHLSQFVGPNEHHAMDIEEAVIVHQPARPRPR